MVFRCFQRVQTETNDMKWVNNIQINIKSMTLTGEMIHVNIERYNRS